MIFLWLIFYAAVMLLANRFAPMSPWAIPMGLLVSTSALLGWLYIKKRKDVLGLKILPLSCWKRHVFFLPHLLPAVYNLLHFPGQVPPLPEILGLFLAAALEEVLFRGLLLPALCKKNLLSGCMLASLVFAASHFLNLETGGALPYVLAQAVFAMAVGFALSGLALSCESLLPCIGIHFLINLTAGDASTALPHLDPLFWACILVSFFCGLRSISLLKKQTT